MRSDVLWGSGKIILTFVEETSTEMSMFWQFDLEDEIKPANAGPDESNRGRLERILSIVDDGLSGEQVITGKGNVQLTGNGLII